VDRHCIAVVERESVGREGSATVLGPDAETVGARVERLLEAVE